MPATERAITPESISELRRRLGLNQAAFADLVGCTQAAVSRWEDGVRSPKGLYARAVRDLMAAHPLPDAPAQARAAR